MRGLQQTELHRPPVITPQPAARDTGLPWRAVSDVVDVCGTGFQPVVLLK